MGRTATPYAGAFFAMVGIGGLAGAVMPLVLVIVEGMASSSFDFSGMPGHPILGFFMGMLLAGSGAGPAVGLHAVAERKVPPLQVPAAVLGAVLGPVMLTFMVAGWPWQFPGMPAAWALVPIAGAAIAVWVTRPLRARGKPETASTIDRRN